MNARTWSEGASRHWCPSLSSPDTRHTGRLTSHISMLAKSRSNNALMIQPAAIDEDSDDAIIGVTPDGVMTSWNQAAERIYGFTSGATAGASSIARPVTT